MKRYIMYTLETLDHVIMGSQGNQSNYENTQEHIAGSSIRGAYISAYKNDNSIKDDIALTPEYREKLLSPKLKFMNAYLKKDGNCFIPLPLCFYALKNDLKDLNGTRFIGVVKAYGGDVEQDYNRISSGSYALIDGGSLETISPDKIYNLHLNKQIDEENLFRYEALVKGQEFYGVIQCEEDQADEVAGIFNERIVYIGKAKGSGYGKCRIKFRCSMDYREYLRSLKIKRNTRGKELVIYFLSSAILRNGEGQIIGHIDEKLLEERLGIHGVTLKEASVLHEITSGFNREWKSRLPQETSVKAGSVLVYGFDGELDDVRVIKLEEDGVGERLSEGFGRIIINPELDVYRCRCYSEEKKKIDLHAVHLSSESRFELQRLVDSIAQKKVEDMIDRTVVSTANQFSNKLTESQIGRLLAVIQKARRQDRETGKQTIQEFKKGLTEATSQKYKLTTVFVYSLYSLLDLIVDDKKSFVGIVGGELGYTPISLGDIKGRDISEMEFEIKLLYLQKLLHFELRKGDKKNGY